MHSCMPALDLQIAKNESLTCSSHINNNTSVESIHCGSPMGELDGATVLKNGLLCTLLTVHISEF
jgi:hypothetical protein